jgi:hypothetical protein
MKTTADTWANQLALARTELRVAEERMEMVIAQLGNLAVDVDCRGAIEPSNGIFWFSDGSVLESGKPHTASQWASVGGRKVGA